MSRGVAGPGTALTAPTVGEQLLKLRNEAVEARNQLADAYKHLPPSDPRVMVARHIKAVTSSSYLSWIYVSEDLVRQEWWNSHFGQVPPATQDEIEDYERLTAGAFVVYSLSLFEAGVRRLVRALDSTACSGGAAEFKSIYDWLLKRLSKRGWIWSGGDPTPFLDLYRQVRNTIHNNGRYYSRTGSDTHVVWRRTRYDFIHGTAPAFIDWNFNIALVGELISLNREIAEAPLIAGLPPLP